MGIKQISNEKDFNRAVEEQNFVSLPKPAVAAVEEQSPDEQVTASLSMGKHFVLMGELTDKAGRKNTTVETARVDRVAGSKSLAVRLSTEVGYVDVATAQSCFNKQQKRVDVSVECAPAVDLPITIKAYLKKGNNQVSWIGVYVGGAFLVGFKNDFRPDAKNITCSDLQP